MNQINPQNYNEVVFALLIGVLILTVLVCFIIGFIMVYQKKRTEHTHEINTVKSQFSHTLLQSQIEIQEQTLQHLSRELHDNIGQVASLIKINLNTLQLNNSEKSIRKMEDTKDLMRQLLADVKSLSVSLGSDRITQTGLAKAIETEVERLNKTGLFTASFELKGEMPGIDNDKAVILYRMAQEVLNNMVKHSGAKNIQVVLHNYGNVFLLKFADDGVGFNAAEKMNATGAGLRNLKSRALLINAQLQIKSFPEKGTTISIELPL